MARRTRYSDEQIAAAVAESFSVMEVMRKIGMRVAGGSHSHLTRRIRNLGLDTSHFLGQAHNRGKPARNKLVPEEVLLRLPEDAPRPKHVQLRNAMIASGLTYCCSQCKIEKWNGKIITFHVDHINGDWLDNRLENLRFLCPNCHSQTETFGFKKRASVAQR